MPIFKLKLHKTYYRRGFFNIKVDFDRFVRNTDGPIELVLGKSGERIYGRIDHMSNRNHTPRIFGNAKLRDWFQSNHKEGDIIDVDLNSKDYIRIG